MNVLITGGTGFLGRHAAVRLHSLGHEVAILGRNDRIGTELETRGIRYLKADLADESKVVEACRGRDAVIHSGGLASPWGRYELFHAANVLGTRHVIAGCRRHRVGRLVHLSTPSLYFDYRHRLNIRESDPLPEPATAYAATKSIADREIDEAFREGLPAIGIRPRAIFGPGDQAVLVRVLRAAERGKVPLVNGGESYVDMVYVDNCVDALLLCLSAREIALGRNYNITNGEPLKMREMTEMLFSALGTHPRYLNVPFGVLFAAASAMEAWAKLTGKKEEPVLTRYGVGLMSRSQTLDISAARETLGYEPRISMREGMRRFAAWWRRKDDAGASYAEKLGLTS